MGQARALLWWDMGEPSTPCHQPQVRPKHISGQRGEEGASLGAPFAPCVCSKAGIKCSD